MTTLLGIFAFALMFLVAFYAEGQDKLPRKFKIMIWTAGLATITQTAASYVEQRTFEKQVLGGDSYVYATLEGLGDGMTAFKFWHDGEQFPVYDVDLELYDIRKFENIVTRDPRTIFAAKQDFQRSVFGPNQGTTAINTLHPSDCYGYWAGWTNQRNGQFLSVIQARKIGGKWLSATRVFRVDKTKIEFVKEYSAAGWDKQAGWPTVTIPEVGSFHTVTPKISCSDASD